MNVKLKKRNESMAIDYGDIARVSSELGINEKLTELLYLREICGVDNIRNFLSPDVSRLYDPFLMKGITEAVERINAAIEAKERIVVYGDYDADGICAAAILSLYFKSRGIDVYAHIPNRMGEGYGLNIESLEKIIDSVTPDLIITCDCGISATKEVEHVLDLGVDIIVTDHHEIAEEMPECIVVNPKQGDYPINYLCGAGVVLKLVHALGGAKSAVQYLDLACIATIADLVPFLDENRLIVQLGLKEFANRRNKGLCELIDSQKLSADTITSGDIAYKIAPRINAAGRMGDAYRAFELLTSDDDAVIKEIVNEINDANSQRKDVCDTLYDEAIADIAYEDIINNRAIVLSHPTWEKGLTGILAARLAGDFKRPAFILVKSGDVYKGTSRSIEGVNIYELLSAVSDLLIEFGGHAQAAGFSIAEENVPAFKERVFRYMDAFDDELFVPYVYYDLELKQEEVTLDFVRSLELLEPTGNSFPRPIFKISSGNTRISLCKNVNHTLVTLESGLQFYAFNYIRYNHFLISEGRKDFAIELSLSKYGHEESIKGVMKDVTFERIFSNDNIAKSAYVKSMEHPITAPPKNINYYADSELKSIIDEGNSLYGTLVLAGDLVSYRHFLESGLAKNMITHDYIFASAKNNYNRIFISPDLDEYLMLANYERVILLDQPLTDGILCYINEHTNAKIYIPKIDMRHRFLREMNVHRESFANCFEYIKRYCPSTATSIFSFWRTLHMKGYRDTYSQMVFCLLVFNELGIIKIPQHGYFSCKLTGEKNELTNSKIYQHIVRLKQTLLG